MEVLIQILEDKDDKPLTYNHYYTTTIQKIRTEKHTKKTEEIVKQHQFQELIPGLSTKHQKIDFEGLASSLGKVQIEDMDSFSADDTLTCQMAYYKVRD